MTKIVMKDGNNSGRMEVGQGTRVGRRAALRTFSCVLTRKATPGGQGAGGSFQMEGTARAFPTETAPSG